MGLQILRSPVRLRSRPLFDCYIFSYCHACANCLLCYYDKWMFMRICSGPWSSGYDSRFGCGRSRVRFPPDPVFVYTFQRIDVFALEWGLETTCTICWRASGLVVWFPLWVREVAGSIPAWPPLLAITQWTIDCCWCLCWLHNVKKWGQEGIEPSTSPTLKENHTTRPLARYTADHIQYPRDLGQRLLHHCCMYVHLISTTTSCVSLVVMTPLCGSGNPGSNPGRGTFSF